MKGVEMNKKINILLLVLICTVFVWGTIGCQHTNSAQVSELKYITKDYETNYKIPIVINPVVDDRFTMNIGNGQIIITNDIKKTAISMSPNNVYFAGAGFIIELYVDANGDLMAKRGDLIYKVVDFPNV